MKRILPYFLSFLLLPFIASAQTLNDLLSNVAIFLGNVIVPFLMGIAFLFFVFNAVKYFVVSADDQAERQKARSFALYSIMAFVFVIIFWGLVNTLSGTVGLEGAPGEVSDYVTRP